MRNPETASRPLTQTKGPVTALLLLAAAALAALSIAATAWGATTQRVKLDSTMFAAQVGTTTGGGSVYAGALPDPKLGHGAIVFTTTITTGTTYHVTFQEFFALGSIKGNGSVTATPETGGQYKLAGSLSIKGGTGSYRNASGSLTVAGNINSAGQVMATLKGSFTH